MGGRLRSALETGDRVALAALLSPGVQWGAPGDASPACRNRAEVLRWYGAAVAAGLRYTITELTVSGDRLLVEARVSRPPDLDQMRWTVVTLSAGLVSDVRGFDQRAAAVQAAGLTG